MYYYQTPLEMAEHHTIEMQMKFYLMTMDTGIPDGNFQKEAISALLKTGPAVCKCENQKAVQAHLKYNFFFKWGGNPAEMENVYDPMAQPVYPMPNNQLFQTEIVSPETSIQNLIYNFDTRHDMLTKQATKRIKENLIR